MKRVTVVVTLGDDWRVSRVELRKLARKMQNAALEIADIHDHEVFAVQGKISEGVKVVKPL
jgi:hypothetical protein